MGGRGAAFESRGYSARLKAVEEKIYRDSVEHATLLDAKGNTIFSKSDNSTDSVYFTDDEVRKMKGANLTHNHPSNSTFSAADVSLLTYRALNSIRATGKDRTYQLSKIKSIKAKQDFAKDYAVAQQDNKKVVDKEYNRYKKQLQRGMMTTTEFNSKMPILDRKLNRLNSEWLKKNARSYGYRYSIIERGK